MGYTSTETNADDDKVRIISASEPGSKWQGPKDVGRRSDGVPVKPTRVPNIISDPRSAPDAWENTRTGSLGQRILLRVVRVKALF